MDTHPATAPWTPLRMAVMWVAVVLTLGLLLFSYRYLGVLAAGEHEPYLLKLVDEMTGALVGGTLFFPVRRFVRAHPLTRTTWLRALPLYVPVLVAFGVSATTLMWGVRAVVYPIAGLGHYNYGRMPLRYLMEFPIQAIGFAIIVLAVHAVDAFRDARAREVRAARLESSLAQAQLRNLRLQLQPHFLFNALNTISSTMYRDPAKADEIVSALAELLRASLRTAQTDEVTLETELQVLDQYLGIMRARFGERLRVRVAVQPETRAALVPSMILQPLVENAIRHGNAGREGAATIDVRARREEASVVLEVQDDGPGAAAASQDGGAPWGVGLTATSERLRLLYGDAQRFEAGNAGGGFRVSARFPFRSRAAAEPSC